jgi:hypothetical protein
VFLAARHDCIGSGRGLVEVPIVTGGLVFVLSDKSRLLIGKPSASARFWVVIYS